jgi:hypothetical protein
MQIRCIDQNSIQFSNVQPEEENHLQIISNALNSALESKAPMTITFSALSDTTMKKLLQEILFEPEDPIET